MRKIVSALLAAICLAGCGKGEPENELVGTKWMTKSYSAFMSTLLGGTWNKWYEFTSNYTLDCYWTDASNNIIRSDGEQTYTYNYPDITITDAKGEETSFQFKDKRSFVLVKIDGTLNTSVTFYKQ